VDSNVGRLGEVGKRALAAERLSKFPIKELEVHVQGGGGALNVLPSKTKVPKQPLNPDHGLSASEVQMQLRLEAYQWPRLIFPPLKKSGHAILDACTAGGMFCLSYPDVLAYRIIRQNNATHRPKVPRKTTFL
jgi:hypothetical protein